MQLSFNDWLRIIEDQFNAHSCLVYLSMLKIMRIYKIIADQSLNVDKKAKKLVSEIHFLFFNDENVFSMLFEESKVL